MIVGTVSTIFSLLGIYGFFAGNLFLLYLGMICVILEHGIGIFSGQEKGLTTVWLALFASLVMMARGTNWLQSIALCLCFESTIMFILGFLLIIFNKLALSKTQTNTNSISNSEEIIQELMTKSGLSRQLCTDVYDILFCFLYDNKELAYSKIDNQLIPHLKETNDVRSVGIAFGMLIDDNALNAEESKCFSEKLIKELIINKV